MLALMDEFPSAFHSIRDAFTSRDSSNGVAIALLVGAAGTLLLMMLVHAIRQRALRPEEAADDPERLFEELLGQLDLEGGERKLLRKVVREARLAQPVEALLSPGLLNWAVGTWVEEKGPGRLTPGVQMQLEGIRQRLFGRQAQAG
jgi:hypothetical protein